jgi:hypothetical protein
MSDLNIDQIVGNNIKNIDKIDIIALNNLVDFLKLEPLISQEFSSQKLEPILKPTDQVFNRDNTIKDKLAAKIAANEAAAQNTPISQFILNLQARVYSQIAAQVTNQLFKSDATSGSFELTGGAFVSWVVNNGNATLTIFDPVLNSTTTLTIPVGSLVLAAPGGP